MYPRFCPPHPRNLLHARCVVQQYDAGRHAICPQSLERIVIVNAAYRFLLVEIQAPDRRIPVIRRLGICRFGGAFA